MVQAPFTPRKPAAYELYLEALAERGEQQRSAQRPSTSDVSRARAGTRLGLVTFGVLVATLGLAGLLLGGCASSRVGLGAAFVASDGLGYDSGYPQASIEVAGGDRLVWRAEARVAAAKKTETGDGVGLAGALLGGARLGDFSLLAGPAWTQQKTSAWKKSASCLRAEIDWAWRSHELRLWHDWRGEAIRDLPGGQVARVMGLGYRSPGRLAVDLSAERAWFTSWGAPAPPGTRWTVGALWRIGGR